MLELDTRTITLLLAIIGGAQAVALALFATLVAARYQGLATWVWASVLGAAGSGLLALRGHVPDLWSVIVANGLGLGAVALTLRGANRFLGRARPLQERLAFGLVALSVAALVPLTFSAPDLVARIVVFSLAISALYGMCALALVQGAPRELRGSHWFAAAALGAIGLWMLLRAVLAAASAGPLDSLFAQNGLQLLTFLAFGASQLLWVAGVVAMTTQRLMLDLRRAQAAERTALEQAARDAERRAEESHSLLDALTAANRIIREREQAFRLTFDRLPLGAALIAPDGRFVRVNDALCAIAGYSEAELLRRDVFLVLPQEEQASAGGALALLMDGAEPVGQELRLTRADGAAIWVRATASMIKDDQGQLLHFLALVEDITARKGYEQHLRTIERQMQLVLRTIPEQFWLKDSAGRYLLASHSLARFHGRPPEEFIGRTVEELYAPELAAFIRGGDCQVAESGQGYYAEVQLTNTDGEQRWLTTTRAPVYDDDGTLLGIVGVARDISAAKAAEAALRQSSERLELALWGAELGLWDWDIASEKLEYNAQLAGLVGLTPEQLGATLEGWRRLLHPDDRPAVEAAFLAAIEGLADGIDVEFRIMHADGAWRWNAARGRVVERDAGGRALRLVGVTRDTTDRQEALEQLRAREELLRGISDNLPDVLIYQVERTPDGLGGTFRYLSAGVERLWGVRAEEAYADAEVLWSRFHPEDRPGFDRAARQSHLTLGLYEFEGRVIMPDGTVRWSYSRSTPRVQPDGRVLRSGIEMDITARRRVEVDLQRRVEALQTLNAIGQALTGWTNLGDGLATAAGLLRRLFRAGSATVWDYDAAAGALRPLLLAEPSRQQGRRPLPLADVGLTLEQLERPTASVLRLVPRHPLLGQEEAAAGAPRLRTLLLGLRTRNAVVGLLCIGAADPRQIFTPEDVAICQTVGSLLASALENARLFAQAGAEAAEQERRRLARELHDSVSQALFAANRTAEMLPQLWELDPDEGRAALGDLHRFTQTALAEMRALLIELRPRALIETPLHETLGLLLPAATRGTIAIRQALAPTPLLPAEVQAALYRIAQEALNNAARHARARCVEVRLEVLPDYVAGEPWEGVVTIAIADDGRGFDPGAPVAGHFGMVTMRERAVDIGAQLSITSAVGCGTTITVMWQGVAQRCEEELSA